MRAVLLYTQAGGVYEGKERQGKERQGKERREGKERQGKERQAKERQGNNPMRKKTLSQKNDTESVLMEYSCPMGLSAGCYTHTLVGSVGNYIC